MITETLRCGECHRQARFIVHGSRHDDPKVTDRLRLIAAANRWVIDFGWQAWCPEHRDRAVQR